MPQIPNPPGVRYAFRRPDSLEAAPTLIEEMQRSGWQLDAWEPQGASILLAFTRIDRDKAQLIDVGPILTHLQVRRRNYAENGIPSYGTTARAAYDALTEAINLIAARTGG